MKGTPSFQFYPQDFLADPKVMALPCGAIGIYWILVSAMWVEGGSLTDDEDALRRMSRATEDEWARWWPMVSPLFRKRGSSIFHKRLEQERRAQEERRTRRSEAGKRGAEARWQSHTDRNADGVAKHGSSSSSSLKEGRKEGGPPISERDRTREIRQITDRAVNAASPKRRRRNDDDGQG